MKMNMIPFRIHGLLDELVHNLHSRAFRLTWVSEERSCDKETLETLAGGRSGDPSIDFAERLVRQPTTCEIADICAEREPSSVTTPNPPNRRGENATGTTTLRLQTHPPEVRPFDATDVSTLHSFLTARVLSVENDDEKRIDAFASFASSLFGRPAGSPRHSHIASSAFALEGFPYAAPSQAQAQELAGPTG